MSSSFDIDILTWKNKRWFNIDHVSHYIGSSFSYCLKYPQNYISIAITVGEMTEYEDIRFIEERHLRELIKDSSEHECIELLSWLNQGTA